MADHWEWDTSDAEPGQNPKFRQFNKDEHAPAGEKGLWAILDSVARQPTRPELRDPPAHHDFEPPRHPYSGASSSFADGFLAKIAPPPAASAPPPPVPQAQWSPPPVEARPSAPLAPPPPPAQSPAQGGFGHLFKRQREDAAPASQEGTSLKALFRRIS